jgi:hypothetical protein
MIQPTPEQIERIISEKDGGVDEEGAGRQRTPDGVLLSFSSARQKVLQLRPGKRSGRHVGTHDHLYWLDDPSAASLIACLHIMDKVVPSIAR